MNILMLGNKDSGKTTYMSSAFGLMEKGVSGFFIKTDTSSREWFHKLFQAISRGEYPSATDKRNSYEFSLYYNQKKILDFNWIDYNGGVITEKSIDHLGEDIEKSEGMMIFLEAEALWKNQMFVHRFRRIVSLITQKLEKGEQPLFSLIIVLTKYDRIPGNISMEAVTQTIQPFLQTTQDNKKLYTRIVPVSCTNKGFYNVELPLLDILDSGMQLEYLTACAQASEYNEKYKEYTAKIGIMDWALSKLLGVKTNGELASEYYKKAYEKIELFQSIEVPTKNLRNFVANYKIELPGRAEEHFKTQRNNRSGRQFIEL